jgi:hypothetical protein
MGKHDPATMAWDTLHGEVEKLMKQIIELDRPLEGHLTELLCELEQVKSHLRQACWIFNRVQELL